MGQPGTDADGALPVALTGRLRQVLNRRWTIQRASTHHFKPCRTRHESDRPPQNLWEYILGKPSMKTNGLVLVLVNLQ